MSLLRACISVVFSGASVLGAIAQENPISESAVGVIVSPDTRNIAVDVKTLEDPSLQLATDGIKLNPGTAVAFKLGLPDIYTYACTQLEMPKQLLDYDGGTIRFVLQHETEPFDQVRVIDEHIATEWIDDSFGDAGRYNGLYGWTRQSGGGDAAWILGDPVAHNIAAPWNWIWVDDYARFGDNHILGGNRIQLCVHPHVTARVFFRD